ncbi:MAG: hypothetical protein JNL09_02340 [Anaerolineales bacterium]|nr:hypothetical protein [Anaerolineales bacterium]
MTRISGKVRKDELKQKPIDPLWRGIGCFSFLAFTVGFYFLMGFLITRINEANQTQRFLPPPIENGIPRSPYTLVDYEIPNNGQNLGTDVVSIRRITFGWDWVDLAFTFFFALIAYALTVILYGIFNPPPKDDVGQYIQRRSGRSR